MVRCTCKDKVMWWMGKQQNSVMQWSLKEEVEACRQRSVEAIKSKNDACAVVSFSAMHHLHTALLINLASTHTGQDAGFITLSIFSVWMPQ